MADKALKFEVQVGTDDLTSGLRVATSGVESATQTMRQSLSGIGGNLRELEQPFESVTHHIRGMRQEMFLGSFMARQIGELGVASKETAGLVAGLAGAFLVGNWTGLAVEGVLKLISAFNEAGAEEGKAAEALKKFGEDAAASVGKATASVEGMLRAMKGVSQSENFFATTVIPELEKQDKLKDALMKANEKLAESEDRQKKYIEANYHTRAEQASAMAAFTKKEREDVATATEQLKIQTDAVAALNAQTNRLATGEKNKATTDAATKSLEDQKKIQDEWNAYRQKSYETDLDNWKKHLGDVQQEQLKALVEEAKSAQQQATEESAIRKAALMATQAEEQDRRDKIKAQEDADNKKREQDIKRVADQMAASATGALRSIVDGSQSAGDAIKGLFENIAFEVLGMLIRLGVEAIAASIAGAAAAKAGSESTTQGHIAEAVAGAAASQAFIPFAGPGLAAEAAVGMGVLLEGLTAPLLSSRGGLDRVPFDGMPAILHKDETVLSAPYARGMRKLLANQGEGGGGVINLHFPNALFVDKASLEKLPQDPNFIRGMREARRNRQIP